MNAALIQLRGVTRAYGEGDARVLALNDVDLDIHRGEFVALMGVSGSGKSTCLNVLGSLDQPTAGSYRFRNIEVTTLDRHQRALLRRQWIGFVFQSFHLLNSQSAVENVELPLLYRGIGAKERRRRALRALDQVGLADRAHHRPSQLSGGQQQRVAIARALVIEPDVLLADEPTGNLDSARSHEVMDLLKQLNERGQTIVLVSHEPEMVTVCDRIVRFRDGRVIDHGRAQRRAS